MVPHTANLAPRRTAGCCHLAKLIVWCQSRSSLYWKLYDGRQCSRCPVILNDKQTLINNVSKTNDWRQCITSWCRGEVCKHSSNRLKADTLQCIPHSWTAHNISSVEHGMSFMSWHVDVVHSKPRCNAGPSLRRWAQPTVHINRQAMTWLSHYCVRVDGRTCYTLSLTNKTPSRQHGKYQDSDSQKFLSQT